MSQDPREAVSPPSPPFIGNQGTADQTSPPSTKISCAASNSTGEVELDPISAFSPPSSMSRSKPNSSQSSVPAPMHPTDQTPFRLQNRTPWPRHVRLPSRSVPNGRPPTSKHAGPEASGHVPMLALLPIIHSRFITWANISSHTPITFVRFAASRFRQEETLERHGLRHGDRRERSPSVSV